MQLRKSNSVAGDYINNEWILVNLNYGSSFNRRWKPDHEATQCQKCGIDFSYLIWKHHCRKCGNIFCDNCSSQRRIISHPIKPESTSQQNGYLPENILITEKPIITKFSNVKASFLKLNSTTEGKHSSKPNLTKEISGSLTKHHLFNQPTKEQSSETNITVTEKHRICIDCCIEVDKQTAKYRLFLVFMYLDLKDILKLASLNQLCYEVSKSYLYALRRIQNHSVDMDLTTEEKELIKINQTYLTGHTSYLFALLKTIPEYPIHFFQSNQTASSCDNLNCYLGCRNNIRPEDYILIIFSLTFRSSYTDQLIVYCCQQIDRLISNREAEALITILMEKTYYSAVTQLLIRLSQRSERLLYLIYWQSLRSSKIVSKAIEQHYNQIPKQFKVINDIKDTYTELALINWKEGARQGERPSPFNPLSSELSCNRISPSTFHPSSSELSCNRISSSTFHPSSSELSCNKTVLSTFHPTSPEISGDKTVLSTFHPASSEISGDKTGSIISSLERTLGAFSSNQNESSFLLHASHCRVLHTFPSLKKTNSSPTSNIDSNKNENWREDKETPQCDAEKEIEFTRSHDMESKGEFIRNPEMGEENQKVIQNPENGGIVSPTQYRLVRNQGDIKNSKSKPVMFSIVNDIGQVKQYLFKRDSLKRDFIVTRVIFLMIQYLQRDIGLDIDLDPIHYLVLLFNNDSGLIEIVPNSHTLYDIRNEYHTDLQNFILKMNGNEKINTVQTRFINSLAVYSVITYLLGIGDRHLDNIMIHELGLIFHIDFEYILGEDPKFLTQNMRISDDMLKALGGKNSDNYQILITRCTEIFNCLRSHYRIFYCFLSLLSTKELSKSDIVKFLNKRFEPDKKHLDAESFMSRIIADSHDCIKTGIFDTVHRFVKLTRGSGPSPFNPLL
mgnify:CR=1 FL=1